MKMRQRKVKFIRDIQREHQDSVTVNAKQDKHG